MTEGVRYQMYKSSDGMCCSWRPSSCQGRTSAKPSVAPSCSEKWPRLHRPRPHAVGDDLRAPRGTPPDLPHPHVRRVARLRHRGPTP
ncbi:hypothetical protein ACU686_30060 [Yinghuangia aomiensis]